MGDHSRWDNYPITYRANEIKRLAGWIEAGESGAVVGLPGTGRATLLNFLCHRPEALAQYLKDPGRKIVLIPVDLNNLPNNDLSTLYRVILRSIYENRGQFEPLQQEIIANLYEKYQSAWDPFLPQSGLREILLMVESEEKKVVLVMNRFDSFCKSATPRMTGTLRGLRDSFKQTLCYIMGMSQEVTYFSDLPSVEPLYSILDTHILWVGPLNKDDGSDMVRRELGVDADPDTLDTLYTMTGGYASLIRVTCHWWPGIGKNQPDLAAKLLEKKSVQNRLGTLFKALTQEEQLLLRDIAKRHKKKDGQLIVRPTKLEKPVLEGLCKKGVCLRMKPGWGFASELMQLYPKQAPGQSWGKIWWNDKRAEIYQGMKPVHLTPLEHKVLEFFIKNPQRRHTYTEMAEGAWPDDNVDGVTTEAIQQVIRGIRKRVEPETSTPRYIISWRGQPEGGYKFFPEGRPN